MHTKERQYSVDAFKKQIQIRDNVKGFDLVLTGARSGVCYRNDQDLIPKEGAVIVCKLASTG